MEVLNCHITIGSIEYDFVHEVQIESTWQELTQKGTITLPANIKVDRSKLKELIKKGMEVTIKLGLNGDLNTAFEGFVSRVHPKVPMVIDVEDLMWKLKQVVINDNAKNETMQAFLSRNIPYEVDCFDIQIPSLIASKITAAQLMDQIRSDFGLRCFIRNGKVVIGKQYDPNNYLVHIGVLDYNILSDDLEYTAKDDVKIKVNAISNLSSGEKIEIELGDPEGEERSLNFYNLTEPELRKLAEKEMERLVYDGYRGSVTFFGAPFIRHGDVVELRNQEESDKTGRYWVDGVTYTFGVGGFRQAVKLGSRT